MPAFVLCAGYCSCIVLYRKWFVSLRQFIPPETLGKSIFFSIVIPARNEEKNIGDCLASVFQNQYPATHFEVLVIDDHSTDKTAEIVSRLQTQHPNLRLLSLAQLLNGAINSYKKKAIELAIGQSAGEWIITTDADCIVPENWLHNFNGFIQQNQPAFIAAPVSFLRQPSWVSLFQSLDFMSLQGITAASVAAGFHSMCNGANLAYQKKAFDKVNGFSGIDTIASGDDMLLMHKINKQFPGKARYLFSRQSIVKTQPAASWKSFINQRIRWASKANKYDDKRIFYVLLLVYFFNVALFVLFVAAFFVPQLFLFWLMLLLVKTVTELYFLFPVAAFFGQKDQLKWFPFLQPVHIVYTVAAGWLGKFGSYEWKGRNVK